MVSVHFPTKLLTSSYHFPFPAYIGGWPSCKLYTKGPSFYSSPYNLHLSDRWSNGRYDLGDKCVPRDAHQKKIAKQMNFDKTFWNLNQLPHPCRQESGLHQRKNLCLKWFNLWFHLRRVRRDGIESGTTTKAFRSSVTMSRISCEWARPPRLRCSLASTAIRCGQNGSLGFFVGAIWDVNGMR